MLMMLMMMIPLHNCSPLHPIILVPGDGGSQVGGHACTTYDTTPIMQVEGRLNKTSVVHYMCSKTSDWYTLWLNLEQMIPTVSNITTMSVQVLRQQGLLVCHISDTRLSYYTRY